MLTAQSATPSRPTRSPLYAPQQTNPTRSHPASACVRASSVRDAHQSKIDGGRCASCLGWRCVADKMRRLAHQRGMLQLAETLWDSILAHFLKVIICSSPYICMEQNSMKQACMSTGNFHTLQSSHKFLMQSCAAIFLSRTGSLQFLKCTRFSGQFGKCWPSTCGAGPVNWQPSPGQAMMRRAADSRLEVMPVRRRYTEWAPLEQWTPWALKAS